ncbi:hypothetical protein KC364_g5 [Hortaea werneckii]|nr:hypothetical protein KC364_g5 [Hortaea werneckii]
MITIIKAIAKVNDQKHGTPALGTNAKITRSSSSITYISSLNMPLGSTAPLVTEIAFAELALRRLTSAIEIGGTFLSPLRCRLSSVSRTAETMTSLSILRLSAGDASIPSFRALGLLRHQCRLRLQDWVHLKRRAEAFAVIQTSVPAKVLPFLPGVLLLVKVDIALQRVAIKAIHHPLFMLMTAQALFMLNGMARGGIPEDSWWHDPTQAIAASIEYTLCKVHAGRFDTVFARQNHEDLGKQDKITIANGEQRDVGEIKNIVALSPPQLSEGSVLKSAQNIDASQTNRANDQTNHEDAADGEWKDQTSAHGSGWRKVTKANSQQRHVGPVDSIQVRPAFDFAHKSALTGSKLEALIVVTLLRAVDGHAHEQGDDHVNDSSKNRVIESRAQRVPIMRGVLSREVVSRRRSQSSSVSDQEQACQEKSRDTRASASALDSQRAMPDPRTKAQMLKPLAIGPKVPASSGQALLFAIGVGNIGFDIVRTQLLCFNIRSIDRSRRRSRCSRTDCSAVNETTFHDLVNYQLHNGSRVVTCSEGDHAGIPGKTMTWEGQCAVNMQVGRYGGFISSLFSDLIRIAREYNVQQYILRPCVPPPNLKRGSESQQTNFTARIFEGKWTLTAHGGSDDGRAHTMPHGRRTRLQAPSLAPAPRIPNLACGGVACPQITVDDNRRHAFAVVKVVVSNQAGNDFVASLLNQLVELFVRAIRFTGCSADEAESTQVATGNPNCGLSYPSGVGAGVEIRNQERFAGDIGHFTMPIRLGAERRNGVVNGVEGLVLAGKHGFGIFASTTFHEILHVITVWKFETEVLLGSRPKRLTMALSSFIVLVQRDLRWGIRGNIKWCMK